LNLNKLHQVKTGGANPEKSERLREFGNDQNYYEMMPPNELDIWSNSEYPPLLSSKRNQPQQ